MKLLLVFACAALTIVAAPRPAAADPSHDHRKDRSRQKWVWITPEELQSQNLVFPGHDGHIMPPTPQDWANYHAAEARAAATRPLFPCDPPHGGNVKRRH